MESLLCRIGSLGAWVPALTIGKRCEAPLEEFPSATKSLKVCACKSCPSSQFKGATVASSSTSSPEELTSNGGGAASPTFNPLPLLSSGSAIPEPLKFLWFNRNDEEVTEARDQDILACTGEADDDDDKSTIRNFDKGEEILNAPGMLLNTSELPTPRQETCLGEQVLMEPLSESKKEDGKSSMVCEAQFAGPPEGSSEINSPVASPPLRHWMSKIAALWPDPSYFRFRSAPTHMRSLSESLSVSFDTSGTDVEEASCMQPPSSDCCDKDEAPCSLNGRDSCCLEVSYTRVTHTRESFSEFLQAVSLYDMKIFAQLAFLCDMAYTIPSIEVGELMKYHHLKLVVSSLDKKAETEVKTKESELSKKASPSGAETVDVKSSNGCVNSQSEPTLPNSSSSSVECSEQPLHSHLSFVRSTMPTEEIGTSFTSLIDSRQKVNTSLVEKSESNKCMDQESLMAIAPTGVGALAEEKAKVQVAKDLPSTRPCPCEWFVCDEQRTLTRLFVIQGSESLASWQANLFFEPTQFEGLDVFVHHGIYEAAKALYDQVLPEVLDHFSTHGDAARARFTGHSLGGSLAVLLALMLQVRGVLPSTAVLPVITFGSPFIMCGGDYLLRKMQIPKSHIQSVIMHRDVVPRAFACDYPDHVAEVLRRLNGRFRDHPCLNDQKLLYSPMGQLYILQPETSAAPSHPLLPDGHGLFRLGYSSQVDEIKSFTEIRAVQRAFLNSPHPLDILSDPGAYGFDGTVSRDHDPRSYTKAVQLVLKDEVKRLRRMQRDQRRQVLWPLVITNSSTLCESTASTGTKLGSHSVSRAPALGVH